eukprot:m.5932 g.5932  ORF g.5932 m.5932 type:complete len:780 (+) comp3444_c0_seq1:272-2611(+)
MPRPEKAFSYHIIPSIPSTSTSDVLNTPLHPPVSANHRCEITKQDLLCGQCKLCIAEEILIHTQPWFAIADLDEQREILSKCLSHCPIIYQHQVAKNLHSMLQKDTGYSIELYHQKSTLMCKDRKADVCRLAFNKDNITGQTPASKRLQLIPQRHSSRPMSRKKKIVQTTIEDGSSKLMLFMASSAPEDQKIRVCHRLLDDAQVATLRSLAEILTSKTAHLENFKASEATSTNSSKLDIIKELPVHLAKFVFGFLDYSEVERLGVVSRTWHKITREVLDEKTQVQDTADYLVDLNTTCDALLSREVMVTVDSECGPMEVKMHEKNIFCGVFSVVAFPDDCVGEGRCVDFNSEKYVLSGSKDKKLSLWDAKSGRRVLHIPGHAGQIQCVKLAEAHGIMISGATDSTVRIWNINTGHCDATFDSCHTGSVLSLDAHIESGFLISGSADKTLNVWSLHSMDSKLERDHLTSSYLFGSTGQTVINLGSRRDSLSDFNKLSKTTMTTETKLQNNKVATVTTETEEPPQAHLVHKFKHEGSVTACRIYSTSSGNLFAATGTDRGALSFFDIRNQTTKRIWNFAHRGEILDVDINDFFIATAGQDCLANIWNPGLNKKSKVLSLRHTSTVTAIKMSHVRIITGAQDGKIRIWNFLNGDIIRIFRGNGGCDPIVSISFQNESSLAVNTSTTMSVLNFSKIIPSVKSVRSARPKRRPMTSSTGTFNLSETFSVIGLQKRPHTSHSSSMHDYHASKRIDNYRRQMPLLRTQSNVSFSGQWRSQRLLYKT